MFSILILNINKYYQKYFITKYELFTDEHILK